MQEESDPRSNAGRSARTQQALKQAARTLFVEKGYAATGTPEIVKLAKVTRGALYHHYADKTELFAAVVEDECKAVAKEINARGGAATSALLALKAGADAFIDAYIENGRTRLVLLEAQVVLGRKRLIDIEDETTRKTLATGLRAAIASGEIKNLPLPELLELLSSMFDAAAINIEDGMDAKTMRMALHGIIDGLAA